MWQDYVFAVGSILFIVALLPSVWSDDKPALPTSVLTASVLAVYAIVFFTLGLPLSGITSALTAALWTVLALQKGTDD